MMSSVLFRHNTESIVGSVFHAGNTFCKAETIQKVKSRQEDRSGLTNNSPFLSVFVILIQQPITNNELAQRTCPNHSLAEPGCPGCKIVC